MSIFERWDKTMFQAPGWSWSRAGDVGWWVLPGWRSALLGEGGSGLRLAEWLADGRLSTIKAGPHRAVYRAETAAGPVFVKHYLVPGWREMLRQWFRRGKARNESKRAARLQAIGVPTITPIALGEQRRGRFLFENYLITSAIADTLPLDNFVETRLPAMTDRRQARVSRSLAVALAGLTAKLHGAGLVHQDFHPGNILVGIDDQDRINLAMIDLDALRHRSRLSWADARRNLALLNNYFCFRCGLADRQRFVDAYLAARGGGPADPRAFAVGIEADTRAWAERLWRRLGRRCRKTNKYFKVLSGTGCRGVFSRDLSRDDAMALMADPDAPFRGPGARVIKDSRTTLVAEVSLGVNGVPTPVIYKRFNRKKGLDPVLTLFRPSRAWRAWESGQHLAVRALPTPQNLGYFARPRVGRRWLPHHWFPHDTYLATVKAEPSVTLADYMLTVLPTLDAEARRGRVRALGRSLSRLLRTLHGRSLSHRDLKASNILIEGNPAAEAPRLSLIDLVGVRVQHPLSADRRAQNLSRLRVSLADVPGGTRTDALRFLRDYLSWSQTTKAEWKALWREVEARCDAKRAQNRRRERPLS